MKVTVFTSNHKRHNYLINRLSEITSELCVVQESRSVFPGLNQSRYLKNIEIEKYFREVNKAQDFFFIQEKMVVITILYMLLSYKENNVHILNQ